MAKFTTALVLLAFPLTGAARAQSDAPINISLTDYAFTPGALSLNAGTTYHLHFINSGTKAHNFSAPEFFAASQIAADDQAKVDKGLIALESGQSLR